MPAHVISSEQQRDRMLYTPIPKLIVSLSVPTLASQLISVFYNTADTYFVSKLSTSASAAVGVVFSLMSIIQAFGFGIGMGCGSIISRSLGNRDNERANRTASSAFFFAAAVGLLICIAGLCTLRPLMRLLGSTETILPYSESYARIILLAAPIMCASFVLSNTLRSEGEAMLSDRIADLVEYLVVQIVDDPDSVSLEVIDGDDASTIEVSVAEDDVAKVIGRRGRTIKAIRTLARALAARLDTAVEVEVLG